MKLSRRTAGLLPPSLDGYRRSWLRPDIIAGLTLAAVAIPECMGYSAIAQVPVAAGIYTIILPTMVFALIGSSRLLVVGADSATAAILASGIAALGIAKLAPGSDEWLQWACLIALVCGGLLAVARLLRLGFLGDFLSTAVLVGFLGGTGISVMAGQIPAMLGVQAPESGPAWERWWTLLTELGDADLMAVGFAAAAMALLVAGERWAPRFPVAIFVVIGAIAAVSVFGWSDDVAVIGTVHGGWPTLQAPQGLGWAQVGQAAGIAVGCVLVILAQSAATARSFAQKNGERADTNRDIVGLSGANLMAGFSGAFVVNGSPTKTQLLDSQHGRTQVANFTMAVVALLVVVFLDGLLANLPNAVLSAIVFLIAVKLIDLHAFARIRRIRPVEFAVALLTAAFVVLVSVQAGIIAAMVVSLLAIIRRQYRPERFVLSVDGQGSRHYETATPGSQSLPGLIVFRYDADLFYANVNRFADDVMAMIEAAPDQVRWLVLDCSSISDVDYSASATLSNLITFVHSRGAHFVLAGVDPELQGTLLTEGVLADLDPDHVYRGVGSAIRAYRAAFPDVTPAP